MPAKHYPVSARSVATWQSMLFFRTSLQDGCMELQSRAWPARTGFVIARAWPARTGFAIARAWPARTGFVIA